MADESAISVVQDALPSSWAVATFQDICNYIQRGQSPRYGTDPSYPIINQKCIRWEGIRLEHLKFIAKDQWNFIEKSRFVTVGDILWNSTGTGTIGRACVVGSEKLGSIVVDSHVTIVRTCPLINQRYVYYYIRSPFVQQSIDYMQTGSTSQVELGKKVIQESELPIAPLFEQSRIVSKIEELFSDLDKAEEALRKAQTLLKQYRQSVLKAAVTGELTRDWREQNKDRLETGKALLRRILKARREAWEKAELKKMRAKGVKPKDDSWKKKYVEPKGPDTTGLPELPEGWTWASMGQLFNIFIGSTPSRKDSSYWNGTIPWVSSGEVAFCRINKTQELITQDGYNNSSVKIHPAGTVLLAMIGEGKTRGQTAILDIEACHNQNCASIRVSETPIPPEYIYQLLSIRYEDNRQKGQGGNQPALNKELVQAITVPLPPLEEINDVLRTMEEALILVDVLYKDIKKCVVLNCSLRQSILKSAFSGTLVPQDPNDEPASELLKRIAAEKSKQSATLPARRGGPRKKRTSSAPAQQTPAPKASSEKRQSPGLAHLRKSAGMSQTALAKAVGLNQASISQMETGKRAITAEQACKIAGILKISPTALM